MPVWYLWSLWEVFYLVATLDTFFDMFYKLGQFKFFFDERADTLRSIVKNAVLFVFFQRMDNVVGLIVTAIGQWLCLSDPQHKPTKPFFYHLSRSSRRILVKVSREDPLLLPQLSKLSLFLIISITILFYTYKSFQTSNSIINLC